jgi:hypothetical protein
MNSIPKLSKRLLPRPSKSRGNIWETERTEFASLARLPAILSDVEVGWLLRCTADSIGILVREEMLTPLGGAGPDDTKRFATVYVQTLAQNREWLDAATDVIYQSRGKVSDSRINLPTNHKNL